MDRRTFLKGLIAVTVGISLPVQLVSTRVMPTEDAMAAFIEQFQRNLKILASQRTSRLKVMIE